MTTRKFFGVAWIISTALLFGSTLLDGFAQTYGFGYALGQAAFESLIFGGIATGIYVLVKRGRRKKVAILTPPPRPA